MTKVTILGQEDKDGKKLKPIEFMKFVLDDGSWSEARPDCASFDKPSDWENIVLLHRSWRLSKMDLMLAYDTRENGMLVLGHFNDGVV